MDVERQRISQFLLPDHALSQFVATPVIPLPNLQLKLEAEPAAMAGSKTAKQIQRSMSALHRRKSRFLGVALLTVDFVTYLSLLAGVCLLPSIWLKGLCILVAGSMIGRMFGLAHDAAHGAISSFRVLNRLIARIAFFPALTPLESWIISHHGNHHAHHQVKGKDVVWAPLSLAEFRGSSMLGRLWYRFQRTLVGLGFSWIFAYWLPYLFWPTRAVPSHRRPAFRFDRLLVCGYVVGLWSALTGLSMLASDLAWAEPLGPFRVFVFAIVAPFFVWATLSGMIDFVTHTHPRSVWFTERSESSYRDLIRNTPHIVFPFGMNVMFHNFFEHTAHHVDTRIPLYHLPQAQAELEKAFPGELVVEKFGLGYFLKVLRLCRLYDFENHRWLDYDGSPTTEPQALTTQVRSFTHTLEEQCVLRQ